MDTNNYQKLIDEFNSRERYVYVNPPVNENPIQNFLFQGIPVIAKQTEDDEELICFVLNGRCVLSYP